MTTAARRQCYSTWWPYSYWKPWFEGYFHNGRMLTVDELRGMLINMSLPTGNNVMNIVLVGAIGIGKSSFINTLKTAIANQRYIHRSAHVRAARHSATNALNLFRITNKIRMIDIAGIDQSGAPITRHEIRNILNGQMADGQEFGNRIRHHANNPDPRRKVHAVIFVEDNYDGIPPYRKPIIDNWIEEANILNIRWGVMCTKIDNFCPSVWGDIQHATRCVAIHDLARVWKNRYGVAMADIMIMKNYKDEQHPRDDINGMALVSLLKITNLARGTMENQLHVA